MAAIAAKVTEFWANVIRRGDDDCWPWQGYAEDGYGRFFFGGNMHGAHELALTFTTGERRDPALDTCHRCNNSICCNPRHLRFDTRLSNVADMVAAGTHNRTGPGKLNAEKVAVIRKRLAAGATLRALAAEYGVSNSMISMIQTGRRWADGRGD